MSAPVLVLGATGGFGGAVTRELLRRGHPVRAVVRDVARSRRVLPEHPDLTLVVGDAADGATQNQAVQGCRVVVHGVNYPYHRWTPAMARVTATVIAAARSVGATILFPGNVYGLGPAPGARLTEEAPARPTTKKGALRVKLEAALREATADGRARVVIVRAGDFYGPTVRNSLVDAIFGNAARGRTMRALGDLSHAHQWAFVPDLARAAVDLLGVAGRLDPFDVVHFEGHVISPHRGLFERVARLAGKPRLPVRTIGFRTLRVAALVKPVVRELLELRYLFEHGVVLDGSRLRALLPDYADTPLDEAIAATLDSYRAHPQH
jgi:nucleoside-diphosphate-sugar epimerase